METLGEALKIRRLEQRKSVKMVCEILDIKLSKLSRYENNEETPDLTLLDRFAKLYNCSIDWLQGKEDLQVIEDDLESIQKILSENLQIIKRQVDRLEDEIVRYKKIKTKFVNLNNIMLDADELPLNFSGTGFGITRQFNLSKGVYSIEFVSGSPDKYLVVDLFSPKGRVGSVFYEIITKPTSTLLEVSEDNVFILKIDPKVDVEWSINIDNSFD